MTFNNKGVVETGSSNMETITTLTLDIRACVV